MPCEYCKEYEGYPTVNSFLYTKKFAFCHHCNTTYNLNVTLPNKENNLMEKIYVASSWRNDIQPHVVKALREAGYEVYDFKNPRPGDHGFHWSEIDPKWKDWTPQEFIDGLGHPIAERGFDSDMAALRECDICVLVLPCGRSAHLEAGWATGAGKKVFILIPEPCEPELMYKMTDGQCTNIPDLISLIKNAKDKFISLRDFRKVFE